MTDKGTSGEGPLRLDDVIVREIAGEVFLVPIRGKLADLQELFVLNAVGEWIWERLDGGHSLEALAEGLESTFAVTRDAAKADLQVFLSELDEAGLLAAAPERA